MMLKDKVAVIYGAGGAVGGAVARAFASEGAKVFVTGRKPAPVEAVAKEIAAAGGSAEPAAVDALDERAVDEHLQSVIDKAGRVDISFNAVGVPDTDIVGVPLVELDLERFSLPITAYATSYFLTARLAARRMVASKSGVIMTVTAIPARPGTPLNGGYGPAQAAKEALTRELSAELATSGHSRGRSATARDAGDGLAEGGLRGQGHSDMTWEQWQELLASTTHARRGSDAGGDGEHGGLRGFRQGERDDRNDRQPDHGEPGRLSDWMRMIDAAQLRELCLAFPGSAETFPFGPETSVFKVAGKMFALSQLAEHPLRVSLKCEPQLAEELRTTHPAVLPGYHLNKRHWNTVVIDGSMPELIIRDMIEDSYDLVVSNLPLSRRRALDWDPDAA